jgi:hypothetical protein
MLRHACGFALANNGRDTRALQAYLGHNNIQHTVRYTELPPDRFKDFWRCFALMLCCVAVGPLYRGVCHRPVCLQILRARRLVLLGPRCRCPAHDVSLERA